VALGSGVSVDGIGVGGKAVEAGNEVAVEVSKLSAVNAWLVSATMRSISFIEKVGLFVPVHEANRTTIVDGKINHLYVFVSDRELFMIFSLNIVSILWLDMFDQRYNLAMQKKLRTFLQHWGLAILMSVAIFGFSSIPSSEMPRFGVLDFLLKKGGHALGYGLLSLTYLRGLTKGNCVHARRDLFLSWMMATLYSTTDEFHQSFVPGRHPSASDVLIDSLGAAIMLFWISRCPIKNWII
jgi:VanZ family protein